MLRLIVLDAIYFKGEWLAPFATNLTRDLPFKLRNGQTVQHPRMSRTDQYSYYDGDRFQAVELPYSGRDISMFVFLPKVGLDEFLKSFTAGDFETSIQRMRSRKGTVELPRFKLDNDYDLTGVLPAMGMPLAFTRDADFSRMSDEPLYISFVKQKTFVSVNEEGTVAAAVTAIGFRAMAVALRAAAAVSFRGGPALFHGHSGEANRAYSVPRRDRGPALVIPLQTCNLREITRQRGGVYCWQK